MTAPRAEDILDPQYLPTYNRELQAVWQQSVQVNVAIFLLDRIVPFPLELFANHQAGFWTAVTQALYDSAVSGVWRIAVDTNPDSLTILSLKNGVLKNVLGQHERDLIQGRLREVDFTAAMATIEQRITDLRHKVIAHHDRSVHAGSPSSGRVAPGVALTELKRAQGLVNKVIDVLGFNIRYERVPLEYNLSVIHPHGPDPRPDIEIILDDLASRSEILNMPELQPSNWPYLRKNLSREDVVAINSYRKRLGMPPVV